MTTSQWGILAGALWVACFPLQRWRDSKKRKLAAVRRELSEEVDKIMKDDPSMVNHSILMSNPSIRKLVEERRVLTNRK